MAMQLLPTLEAEYLRVGYVLQAEAVTAPLESVESRFSFPNKCSQCRGRYLKEIPVSCISG